MSNIPYYSTRTRFGARMGHTELIDGMLKDGLTDPFTGDAMGLQAEMCAKKHKISRKDMDDFAVESFEKVQTAYQRNMFDWEIVPIEVKTKQGTHIIDRDEGCWKFNEEKLRALKPAFDPNGSITAGNASQISDGASSLILASYDIVRDYNLRPLAKIIGYAYA